MLHQILYLTDSSSSEQKAMKPLLESVYEAQKKEGKMSKTHFENEKKNNKKKPPLIRVKTDVVWRCRRPGPSNSLSRANGSVDNLLLHRCWDRFTPAAYWNCNLAVSMTVGMERLHGNSQSHRTMWRVGINSHNTPPVWEFELRANKEITIYFLGRFFEVWTAGLKYNKNGPPGVNPKIQISLLRRFEYKCNIASNVLLITD